MAEATPSSAPAPVDGELTSQQQPKPWHISFAEGLQRTVNESADSAIRSARSLQHNSSSHLRSLREFMPHMESQYRTYEDAFFKKVKDELMSAKEHPYVAGAVAVTTGLIFLRGPRRFLFRHTLGRFQSEEAQFVRAEKNVDELKISIELMKNESKKLLQRTALAENDMKQGRTTLMNIGTELQRLSRTAFKVEAQACDLMDGLRETPGREALKLRSEVASMASLLKHQRIALDKRILKISELGIPV